MAEERKITELSERDQVRKRTGMWLGSNMPRTIMVKEIIDNTIDVINEKKQAAKNCVINVTPNRLLVMDDGLGISTEKNEDGKTHLQLAIAKLFTSSNFEGENESIGANGVGSTIANFTSNKFFALNFNYAPRARIHTVRGYEYTQGCLNGSDELQNLTDKDDNNLFSPADPEWEDGDYVENPLSYEDAVNKIENFFGKGKIPYETGYLVAGIWEPSDSNNKNFFVFKDIVDMDWIYSYTRSRAGEIDNPNAENIVLNLWEDDDMTKLYKTKTWNKSNPDDKEHFVPSWHDCVDAMGRNATIVKSGPWQFAFSLPKDDDKGIKEMHIDSIVQGAPIDNTYVITQSIKIQEEDIKISIPYSLYYNSKEYPPYSDQTKTSIKRPYSLIAEAFERSGDIYKYYYREAEKRYMVKAISDSDSSMFWPQSGPSEEAELIIAEGYSAVSGLKGKRNPVTQACIALRGKISNTWNLDMVKAMRSDIIKQLLNTILKNDYKRIIIAVDADKDGNHIAALLIALFKKYTNIISEGKLYLVDTPLFIFKKGNDIKWSQDEKDCPPGYKIHRNKGLGSLEPKDVKTFIMDESTRSLIQIIDDQDSYESLDLAFSTGGETWIQGLEKLI